MLEIDGLTRSFGDVQALSGLSFAVEPGRLCGFLGPNGSGKTTAMRIIMGITAPDAGQVRWDGRAIDLSSRQRFGYMPEERGLYPRMGLRPQLVYLARLHGVDTHEATRRADHWLERVGLSERADDRVEDLSLGNQQRVQLAAALVHDPELLVLDEPFSGLDPIAVEVMADVLRERAAAGAAVVFSSHQLDLVEDLCQSVAIISHGHQVLTGDVAELKRRGRSRVVVGVDGGDGWIDGLDVERLGTDADGRVSLLPRNGLAPQTVLAAATRAGTLTHFSVEQPTLSELFRDAVGGRATEVVA